jgi:putative tricarboxylic transport membrane protein
MRSILSTRLVRTFSSAGPFFIAAGIITLLAVWDYPAGTAVRMGPGYWPRLLGFLLIGLGVLIWLAEMRRAEETPASMPLRPILMILVSIIAFALAAERLGLVAAIAVSVLLSVLARPGARLAEAMILTVGLVIFSALLFVKVLGVSLPLLPNW